MYSKQHCVKLAAGIKTSLHSPTCSSPWLAGRPYVAYWAKSLHKSLHTHRKNRQN